MLLTERLTWDEAKLVSEGGGIDSNGKPKDLYLKGIFIQGGVRNHNGRIYPVNEIKRAVDDINAMIARGETVWGEADHPEGLTINLDRISHYITEMWMEGPNGCGKLKIIPTPIGNIVRTLIEVGGKLGVSSRGSGNVNSYTGEVSDFQIVTVDIVARPSAPNAYPNAVYERKIYDIFNYKKSGYIEELALNYNDDRKAREILKENIKRWLFDSLR